MQFKPSIYIVLFATILLYGCGFEPLYVEKKEAGSWYYGSNFDSSISEEMSQVKIQPIADRFGQIMRNELLDLLTPRGVPKEPKYRLFVTLRGKLVSDQALRSE